MLNHVGRTVGLSLVAVAIGVAAVLVATNLLRPNLTTSDAPSVAPPRPGEARPDYLPDGTPIWVMGHDDGSVSVLSGFDTHMPYAIGKLLWWCDRADGLENPHHGSHWDEFGRRLGGPAPRDLPHFDIRSAGARLVLGEALASRTVRAPVGPAESDREWCNDQTPGIAFHTFEGWELHRSPEAAIDAAPDGWILLEAVLEQDPATGGPILCAVDGCADAARLDGLMVEPNLPRNEYTPFGRHERYIAQVRDGPGSSHARRMAAAALIAGRRCTA